MFGGRWTMVEPIDQPWLEGKPELLIGHFGSDLVGTIRYLDELGFPTQECKCGIVQGIDVDLDNESFLALTDDCNGEITWSFVLGETPDGDPVLNARVASALPGTPIVDVVFELDDRFVPDELKACPAE